LGVAPERRDTDAEHLKLLQETGKWAQERGTKLPISDESEEKEFEATPTIKKRHSPYINYVGMGWGQGI